MAWKTIGRPTGEGRWEAVDEEPSIMSRISGALSKAPEISAPVFASPEDVPSVKSALDRSALAGAVETGASLVSGIAGGAAGGIAGLATLNPEMVGKVSNAMTYEPRTATGKAMTNALINYPMEQMEKGADWAGEYYREHGATPTEAAAMKSSLMMLPSALMGVRPAVRAAPVPETPIAPRPSVVPPRAAPTPSPAAPTPTPPPQTFLPTEPTPTFVTTKPTPTFEPRPGDMPDTPRHKAESPPAPEPIDVPLDQITMSKDVPQFKAGGDERGLTEPLSGPFDRRGLAPIQLWDRTNGRLELISGRHRYWLAKDEGEYDLPAQIYKESDGFTAEQAMTLDAELNIKDGHGSIADYANYFRIARIGPEEAVKRGLVDRYKGKAGLSIAHGASEDTFVTHRAGLISDEAAFEISRIAPQDSALQAVGLKLLKEGKSIQLATNTMQAVRHISGHVPEQTDIFGMDTSMMDAALKMAKKAAAEQQALSEQVSAIQGASKRPEVAAKYGIDVKDPESIRNKVAQLRLEQQRWSKWQQHPDLIKRLEVEMAAPKPKVKGKPAVAVPVEPEAPKIEPVVETPPPKPSFTFETKDGSYGVGDDGLTTFGDEAPRKTFYVTPARTNSLAEVQVKGAGKRALVVFEDKETGQPQAGMMYLDGKNVGNIEQRTVVPISTEPEAGLIPVQTWSGGREVNFGSKITKVNKAESAKPEPTPEDKPASVIAAEKEFQRQAGKQKEAETSTKIYRGYGRKDKGAAYNPDQPGESFPVAGEGKYYAFSEEDAKRYGPKVEEASLDLANPLVITDGEQWKALTKMAGWKFPNPSGTHTKAAANQLKKTVTDLGHDGIVINWDNKSPHDIGPKGENYKLLNNVFDVPTVIDYRKGGEPQLSVPIKPEKPEEPVLKGQTEAEIKQKEEATKRREDEVARQLKKAEEKEKADKEVDDFNLTGSDRPADKNPYQKDILDLNVGVNPVQTIKAIRDDYSPFVGVEAAKRKHASLKDTVQKWIAPASRSPEASLMAGNLRNRLGEQAWEYQTALAKFTDVAAAFDKMPQQMTRDFIKGMETHAPQATPQLDRFAALIRTFLDQKREQVRALGTGALDNFFEDYFPHIWADKQKAADFFGHRPFEGNKAFLKKRYYDTFEDGIDAGLRPLTENPMEMALLKAREMDRYIYAQKAFIEAKQIGLARFFRKRVDAPEGWAQLDDSIARVHFPTAKGMVQAGHYYAPEPAALVFNNNLTPGMRGNTAFDMIRGAGNMMNSAQLGFSAFHAGFTTLDALISKNALGVKQLSRGDLLQGTGNVLQSFNPYTVVSNYIKGNRLRKAYLDPSSDPQLAPMVDALVKAGGRIGMDDFYRNTTINGFKQALRGGRYFEATWRALPTFMDRIMSPLFENLVPRQKLGVFFDLAKDWTEQNPGADLIARRKELGKIWDSVDNRMGELVYDNLFWNRALKDGLMASTRSVGWNLGTFREIGGGVADMRHILKDKELSTRASYVIALPFMTSIIGSTLNYLYTGEYPKDLKDTFFPRTGKIRPNGEEDRLSLPSYMKDVYEYYHDLSGFVKYGTDPFRTLENKAHPLISIVAEMIKNKDYYGASIREPSNPNDPLVQNVYQFFKDFATHMGKGFVPFSVRNYLQRAKTEGEDPTFGGYVTGPSMIGITPAPGYITKSEAQEESSAIRESIDPLSRKYRQELREGASKSEIDEKMKRNGFTMNERRRVFRSAQENKPLPPLRKYGQ